MEIHQLEYFVAVAETAGFSRAAKRCNVSQPSLSQQIIKLEQELGEKLFDRLGRSVALTEAGTVLLPKAKRILAELQTIQSSALKEEIKEGSGHLSVGFIPTIAPFVLPDVLTTFQANYEEATLSVTEGLTDDLIELLIKAEIDVAVMSLPISHKLIETEVLATEPMLIAVSAEKPFFEKRPRSMRALEGVPFIALNEIHCFGEQVQAYCYEHKLALDVVCYTAQLSTIKRCVESGLGISIVPKLAAVSEQQGGCRYIAVAEQPPTRTLVAAWHNGRIRSRLADAFIEQVRATCEKLLSTETESAF